MFVDIGAYGIPKGAWEGNFDAIAAGMWSHSCLRTLSCTFCGPCVVLLTLHALHFVSCVFLCLGVAVETFVRSVKGFQMLYADCYLSEQEFRNMFDHTVLDKVRAETGADVAFPTPWEKMCKKKYESVFEQKGQHSAPDDGDVHDLSSATTPRRSGLRPRK